MKDDATDRGAAVQTGQRQFHDAILLENQKVSADCFSDLKFARVFYDEEQKRERYRLLTCRKCGEIYFEGFESAAHGLLKGRRPSNRAWTRTVFWLKPKAHCVNADDEPEEEAALRKCFVSFQSGQIKDRLLPEDNSQDWLETCRAELKQPRWVVRLDEELKPDINIAVRMDAANEGIRDYYLLPGIDMTWDNLRVAEDNGVYLDKYRFETLDYFFGMAVRVRLQEAA
jgi:hypothetical protein